VIFDLLMIMPMVGGVGVRGGRARRKVHISTLDGHSDGIENERDW